MTIRNLWIERVDARGRRYYNLAVVVVGRVVERFRFVGSVVDYVEFRILGCILPLFVHGR